MIRTIQMIGLLALLLGGAAYATVTWMTTFNNLYTPAADSQLKKARCVVCHRKPGGKGGLNCYGAALNEKAVSAESLKSVENLDSDKDSFSNINEIKAGTLPGKAISKPSN